MTINMFEASSPKPTPGAARMTPAHFAAKWANVNFGEKQASQEMFLDICAVVGHPTPGDIGSPETFTFEKAVPGGFADAFLEGCFGWEFKGSDDQLTGAFNQLLRYQVYLKTPPLLIVSSFHNILIRTNFPGMETVLHTIPVAELAQAENLEKLRHSFFAPDQLRPGRSVEDVTKETATLFGDIVTEMERHTEDPEKLARYLNQIVFCLYAEDSGLLPSWSVHPNRPPAEPQPRKLQPGRYRPIRPDGERRHVWRGRDCPLQRRPVQHGGHGRIERDRICSCWTKPAGRTGRTSSRPSLARFSSGRWTPPSGPS